MVTERGCRRRSGAAMLRHASVMGCSCRSGELLVLHAATETVGSSNAPAISERDSRCSQLRAASPACVLCGRASSYAVRRSVHESKCRVPRQGFQQPALIEPRGCLHALLSRESNDTRWGHAPHCAAPPPHGSTKCVLHARIRPLPDIGGRCECVSALCSISLRS